MKAKDRSLTNFIERAVKAHIQESAFVDDSEMTNILANKRLVGRLRRGSRDAKEKKATAADHRSRSYR